MAQVLKITLRAEPAPEQNRPTQQETEAENQEECFAPFQPFKFENCIVLCHKYANDWRMQKERSHRRLESQKKTYPSKLILTSKILVKI